MDAQSQVSAIEDLASRLGIEVRYAPLGGDGGGLCVLKGRRVLFLDSSADVMTQCGRSFAALAQIPEIDTIYIEPVLRERLMRSRSRD